MLDARMSRRQAITATAAAALGLAVLPSRANAVELSFTPDPKLVEAAKSEGKLVLYTSSFIEVMQEMIAAFNKRFPFVNVYLVRAPTGQLVTRIQTEAASGKLAADIVDQSDPAIGLRIESLFQPYAPPNAADFRPNALVSPKLWPTIANGWCIAYNTELVKVPPQTWGDLCKPEYGDGLIGQVIGPSGGNSWARIMFERMVLGEDYWARQAKTKPRLFPSAAPAADSLVRGEVGIAPLIYDIIYPKKRDGAPVGIVFGREGVPTTHYASGILKSASHPAAARLFMDWLLSPEGQYLSTKRNGDFSMLKNPPAVPERIDPRSTRLWVPNLKKSQELHDTWLAEWNLAYGQM
jgi:iron(III) transport system substrate-binding protein